MASVTVHFYFIFVTHGVRFLVLNMSFAKLKHKEKNGGKFTHFSPKQKLREKKNGKSNNKN